MIEIIFKDLTTEEVDALTRTLRRVRKKRKPGAVAQADGDDPPPDDGPGGDPPR